MAISSSGVIAMSAQALLLLSVISCTLCAKLPQVAAETQALQSAKINSGAISSGTVPAAVGSARMPIVASPDDLEVVAHTGGEGRYKRYIGWGRRPSLRYNKAVSVIDHDSLFNRLHNNFDKRAGGPEAPISSFRELRMKQKVPNIQLLLPHLTMRDTRRIPEDEIPLNEDRAPGERLTQEDMEELLSLLGDVQ